MYSKYKIVLNGIIFKLALVIFKKNLIHFVH